ncbi:MAG: polysaccharide biosynthesis/export family protein [Deltaproteobacteria bacterium]|nr:polysaccharide biosynthesis/export family protein [Deltaproteobacteria bacterium]
MRGRFGKVFGGGFTALVATAALSLTLGCSPPPAKAPKLPPPVESASLGPDDVFEVTVYDEPAMSKAYRVAPNGTINFPLIGTLQVEGKEPQQVQDLITTQLQEKKILKNPSVSILVKEVNSKKVAVFGQVQKPGQFPMTAGITLVQAISLAGGFTALADRDRVTINRKVASNKILRAVVSVAAITEGRLNDVPLQAGDTIYVEERVF